MKKSLYLHDLAIFTTLSNYYTYCPKQVSPCLGCLPLLSITCAGKHPLRQNSGGLTLHNTLSQGEWEQKSREKEALSVVWSEANILISGKESVCSQADSPEVVTKVYYQSSFSDLLASLKIKWFPSKKSGFPELFPPPCGCLNSPSLCKCQELHHITAAAASPFPQPPSHQSLQHGSQKGLEPEMNHKHKERKMYKHMEERKLSWKVAEFIFTLQELSSRHASLHHLEKASESSELLSSGKFTNYD